MGTDSVPFQSKKHPKLRRKVLSLTTHELTKPFTRLTACALALMMILCLMPAVQAEEVHRTHYEIDLTLDIQPENYKMQEKIRVTVLNTSDTPWNEVCFRDYMSALYPIEQGMTDEKLSRQSGVSSVSCGSDPLEVRLDEKDPSILYVALKTPLDPGKSVILDMEYAADIPTGGFRCSAWQVRYGEDDNALIFELAQFYPMLAIMENGQWQCGEYFMDGECFYTRCADFDITLHVPEDYLVVASGEEIRDTQDGQTVWKVHAENMRDVTIVTGNQYDSVSGEMNGVKVTSYFLKKSDSPKGDPDADANREQGTRSLDAALQAISAFTEAYGPYPYGELDVLESCYTYGGMEAPGLVRISQMYSWFIGENNSAEERTEYRDKLCGTVAHEVAHEWFYGVVGNDQYNEAWLDESFAAYSEQVYWRSIGRAESESEKVMAEFEQAIRPETGLVTVNHSYAELEAMEYDYIHAVYQRGAAFLYRLEQTMSQETFNAFMQEYYQKYSFKEAHTEDFVATLKPYISENSAAQALVQRYLAGQA